MATFLFDGDCAFCSSSARWLMRWVPTRADIVAWQQVDIAALGVTEGECDTAVQWVDGDRRTSAAVAIADLLRTSRWWWQVVGTMLGTRAVQIAAAPAYRWVARHRDLLPGGTPQCALPQSQRPRA